MAKCCAILFPVLLLQPLLQTGLLVSAIEPDCENCGCCVNMTCAETYINGMGYVNNYCTHGCVTGIWGYRCYNPCDSQCLTCDQYVKNKCTSCTEGNYLSSGRCINCNERCKSCTSATQCQECMDPYYNEGNVTDCSLSCPENCRCQDIGVCSSCKDGFYNINNKCQDTCQNNCKTCISNNECLSCKDGSYLGNNNEIRDCSLRCLDSCSKCLSSNKCTQCNTGWYGNTCKFPCSVGCINGHCTIGNGTCSCRKWFTGNQCDDCESGRYGEDCEKACSVGCKDNECNRTTGYCSQCKSINIVGNFCDRCVVGKWNSDCMSECPARCKESDCIMQKGNCYSCKGNFRGDNCDRCTAGYYGPNCVLNVPKTVKT